MFLKRLWSKIKIECFSLFSLKTLIVEVCHTLGVALFVFKVLPNVENMFGLFLMNALCIVPAILKVIFASTRGMTRFKRFVTFLFDIIAIVCQLSCVVLFKIILAEQKVC